MDYFLFFPHSNPKLTAEIIQKSNKFKYGKHKISHYKNGDLVEVDADKGLVKKLKRQINL